MNDKKRNIKTPNKKKDPWSGVITNIQGEILKGLARYRFLSLTQMLELNNIGTTQYAYIWKQANSLASRKNPLIFSHAYGVPQPRKGKVENIYYLLPKGKEILQELFELEEKDIKIPKGATMAYKDYHHRKHQIDFQIWLDKWALSKGLSIPFFDCYFDKTGNNRKSKNLKSKTAIQITESTSLIADGAFEVNDNRSDSKFYLFEFSNGKNTTDIIAAIHQHARAMTSRATHRQYGLNERKAYKVAWLFKYQSIQDSVIRRIREEDNSFFEIHRFFVLNSIGRLKQSDFFENWISLLGDTVPFFNSKTC